jgi:beta-glucosidase/6-phospho-beta-glucosidase/beta-galactosidase
VYDFAWLDEVVDGLLKIGIQPWFNLGYGNPLYTPTADATAVGWVPVFDEATMAAWKAFTAALAEHFKGRVTHWEIWNEPNITGFWKPGKPDAASYVKLVEQTAPVIREKVQGAVIIGAPSRAFPWDILRAPESRLGQAHRQDVLPPVSSFAGEGL